MTEVTLGSSVMLTKPLHIVAMMKVAKLNQIVGIDSIEKTET